MPRLRQLPFQRSNGTVIHLSDVFLVSQMNRLAENACCSGNGQELWRLELRPTPALSL